MLALVLTVVTLSLSRWRDSPVIAGIGLALGGVLLLVYLWSQRISANPVTPSALFRRGTFSEASATHFLVGIALIIAMVTVPQVTNTVMGKEPLEGGLRLVRLTTAIPIGALLGGFASARLGCRVPTAAGLILSAVSFYFMSTWDLGLKDPIMTIHLVLGGLGFGLVIAPIAAAAIDSVLTDNRGTAAALLTVMRIMGMTVGMAALTSWGTEPFEVLAGQIPLRDPEYFQQLTSVGLKVFQDFFFTVMVVCLVALIPTWLMRGEKEIESTSETEQNPSLCKGRGGYAGE